MIYPQTTFSGQKVTICNRYIELFRQEANAHIAGVDARVLRSELDALMPEAYHEHSLIWLYTKWNDVLNGNDKLGFPGVPLDARLSATSKKDEAYQGLSAFYKYQREESNPTVKSLLHERHKVMEECRQDTMHTPALSDFKRVDGKLTLDLPSKNPMNESINIAFALRAGELFPDADDEYGDAVTEAISTMHQKGYHGTFWDNKIDKELIRININLPEPPDPLEDFTTYTEVDPFSRLSVTSSTITATRITRGEDAFVYEDKGIGHFDGDFTHLITINYTGDSSVSICGSWALTNDIDDTKGLEDSNKSFLVVKPASTNLILFEEHYAGSKYQDYTSILVNGQPYYLTLERDESIGSFGQLTCQIYSDIDRTISLDILSLLLHSKIDFRYIFGLISHNSGGSAANDLTVSNLDLGEIIAFNGFPFFFDGGHY